MLCFHGPAAFKSKACRPSLLDRVCNNDCIPSKAQAVTSTGPTLRASNAAISTRLVNHD